MSLSSCIWAFLRSFIQQPSVRKVLWASDVSKARFGLKVLYIGILSVPGQAPLILFTGLCTAASEAHIRLFLGNILDPRSVSALWQSCRVGGNRTKGLHNHPESIKLWFIDLN